MENSIYSVDNENFQYLTELEVISDNTARLEMVHYDLQVLVTFVTFFVIVILLKYIYKFFNMFF